MKLLRLKLAAGVASVLAGCGGEPQSAGFEEPFRVIGAQFREGDLPGSAPLTAEELADGVKPVQPAITTISLNNAVIPPREPGRGISGQATPDAAAIGVRFASLGSGYWLFPTLSADPVSDGNLEWRFRAAFGVGLPSGRQDLHIAAFDSSGRAGTQTSLTLCLLPEVPDNGSACIPTAVPPDVVVSLGWDAPVDLDLRVITPSGKVVDPKHPTTAERDEEGKLDTNAKGVGKLDYDSFARCAVDGFRRENLVFQTTPPPGTYLVYAGLFDACGQSGVSFDVSIHVATNTDDGLRPAETFRQAGQLSAVQADGGASLGTYITAFVIE